MSSSVFMKVLESAPYRYDRGIMMLTRGRIKEAYLKIAEMAARPGNRVLDIGCGTGNVSLACAERGADVVGIDINAEMLEIARQKAKAAGLEERIEFLEVGVAELENRTTAGEFDSAVACLTFSELTPDEQTYTLSMARSRLKPGGTIVIADEALPKQAFDRFVHRIVRFPFAASAFTVTQTTTHPLGDMTAQLRNARFVGVESTSIWSGFVIIRGFAGGEG